jgi:gluconate 5-dehydrogenase
MNTSSSPFRLDHEVALITGGGTGLGFAMARRIAEAGATVLITGRREDALKDAVAQIGPNAKYLTHDVTDLASAPDLARRVIELVGAPVSILVNNAGNHIKKPALETTEAEFLTVINTHVMGSFALTRALAPAMIAKKHGSILFIASMASIFGIPQVVAYTAAKSAYTGMVKALATELSPHNVRVNAIAPGWIESAISKKALANDPARLNKILSRTPMNKMGEPDDIGYAAVFLSSPAAKFITGTTLVVDGGASIGF